MPDSTNSPQPGNRLEQLKEAYKKRLTLEFARLREIESHLLQDNTRQESLDALHSALHTIAGAAGTFGFHTLGEAAREFEQRVAKQLSQTESLGTLPGGWLNKLQIALDADNSKVKHSLETTQQRGIEGGPTIWLVERDNMLANYAKNQLTSFGFQVHCLSDANELEKCRSHPPDLLLIDHHAIGAADFGADLAVFWKAILSNYDCPVFFTGAEESFNARLQALRAGGRGIL
ncbi:response regulator [Lacimicrobium alkaliphilum]|uniref:HPt domain-containing protein n=1 Tax=Lacimicrobium alkaliphilum TaxID=1526571 RepID=A0ABQ1RL14_9ALTE|nr:response regulator [Lacimicrobium alkaliphilum]GGD73403.1 hypothetical protein GCM10011357_30620 [Lacimicrobium alkaliphilum]